MTTAPRPGSPRTAPHRTFAAPRLRGIPALALVVVTVGACASGGGPSSEAAGPAWTAGDTEAWATLHEDVRVAGLDDRHFSYDEYWRTVLPWLEESGQFEVTEAGESAEGRTIRLIRYGSGPTPVLLWSQMHGNESTASMALADLFAFLAARPDHPLALRLREETSLYFIPMLNPDGATRFQRRNVQGIDINRDARLLSTPEARALKSVRDQVEPVFAFNLHDQGAGTRVGSSDRGVAIALLSPPFDETRAVNDARTRAIQVAGVIRAAMDPMVGGHIARYDDTFNPRAFGDLITQWGASTILVESGGWRDDPQKQYLRKVNFVGLVAALDAIATESYSRVSMDLYGTLPSNGRRIGDMKFEGGTLVIPGVPSLRADFLVNFDDNLALEGGTFADIGDLGEVEAQDTVDLTGLYIHPTDEALERGNGGVQIQPGLPAHFRVTRDAGGNEVLWIFRGSPPPEGMGRSQGR